jgi:hypothetical protein
MKFRKRPPFFKKDFHLKVGWDEFPEDGEEFEVGHHERC